MPITKIQEIGEDTQEISGGLASLKTSEQTVKNKRDKQAEDKQEEEKMEDFLLKAEQMKLVECNHAFLEYKQNKDECMKIRNKFVSNKILNVLIDKYNVFLKTYCNNDSTQEECKRMFDSELLVRSFGNTQVYARITFTDIKKPTHQITVLDKYFPIEVNFVVVKDYGYDCVDADKNNKEAEEYVKKLVRQCNYALPLVVEGEENPYGKVRYQYLEYDVKTNTYEKVSCLLDLEKIKKLKN